MESEKISKKISELLPMEPSELDPNAEPDGFVPIVHQGETKRLFVQDYLHYGWNDKYGNLDINVRSGQNESWLSMWPSSGIVNMYAFNSYNGKYSRVNLDGSEARLQHANSWLQLKEDEVNLILTNLLVLQAENKSTGSKGVRMQWRDSEGRESKLQLYPGTAGVQISHFTGNSDAAIITAGGHTDNQHISLQILSNGSLIGELLMNGDRLEYVGTKNGNRSFVFEHSARFHMREGGQLHIRGSCLIDMKDGAQIDMEQGSKIGMKHGARIDMEGNSYLSIKDSGRIEVNGSGRVYINDNGQIAMGDSSQIDMSGPAQLEMDGGLIRLNGNGSRVVAEADGQIRSYGTMMYNFFGRLFMPPDTIEYAYDSFLFGCPKQILTQDMQIGAYQNDFNIPDPGNDHPFTPNNGNAWQPALKGLFRGMEYTLINGLANGSGNVVVQVTFEGYDRNYPNDHVESYAAIPMRSAIKLLLVNFDGDIPVFAQIP